MRYVEGGSFEMGSNEYDDEKPIHKVTVSSFWMATTETTVGQYRLYCEATGTPMPTEPSWGWQESHPIVNVNWNDAVAYCEWLSHKTGRTYRLPTEAEWEYAARGGQQSRRTTYAGSNVLDEVGWYTSNTQDKGTKAVGQKRANELGLHDLSGNVWEWCSDWYDQTYYANSSSSNPTGPATGSYRVLRGGSWLINPANNRVAIRCHGTPSYRYIYVGFRVVCLQ
jgi:formylglycine-generating enzyme required for sulfatase activity